MKAAATTLAELEREFPTEQACRMHVAARRFGEELWCPYCNAGNLVQRRMRPAYLRCRGCLRDVSICAGTLFAGSTVPLTIWFHVMLIVANQSFGPTITFIVRHLGISHNAAVHMLRGIRRHVLSLSGDVIHGGPGEVVCIDETWVPLGRANSAGKRGAIVFGIRDSQGVTTRVVLNRSRAELLPLIRRHVVPGSTVVTDMFRTYASLGSLGFRHHALNHSAGQWVDTEGRSSGPIESYWTSLKYSLSASIGAILPAQLPAYVGLHTFRFNVRLAGRCAFRCMISRFPEVTPMRSNSRRPTLLAAPAGLA